MMPSAAAPWRGEQLSLLAKLLHSRQSSHEFEDLILEASTELQKETSLDLKEISERKRNLDLLSLELNRQKRLDSQLVVHLATAQTEGYALWQAAKSENDYKKFAPAFKKLIELS